MSLPDQLSLFLRGIVRRSAPRPAPSAGQQALELDVEGTLVEAVLTRSSRKTVGIRIVEGEIRVSAPHWVQTPEIQRILQLKSSWIARRLQEDHRRLQQRPDPVLRWQDGGPVRYLGAEGRLRLSPEAGSSHWSAEAQTLFLALPTTASADQIREATQGWMQTQARRVLRSRVDLLAHRSGLTISKFSLTSARTRWGSCTHDGHIRLNWRLVHFGLPIIDYVVAHELAHLRAMDHSPDFWREVGEILPGYETAKSELRRVRIDDAS